MRNFPLSAFQSSPRTSHTHLPQEGQNCWRFLLGLEGRTKLAISSLGVAYVCGFACLSVMSPFFPHEAAIRGITDTVTSFIFGIYAFMGFLISPFLGIVIPFLGPKFTLQVGILLLSCSCAAFGLLSFLDDAVAFTSLGLVIRAFQGVGHATYTTAVFAIVAQTFPTAVGVAMGVLEMCVGIGLSLGPAIGAVLYEIGGHGLPFYALGLVLLLTVPLNASSIASDTDTMGGRGIWKGPKALIPLLSHWQPMIVCSATCLIVMNFVLLSPVLQPYMAEVDVPVSTVGLLFVINLSTYTLTGPLSGWLSDKFPKQRWSLIALGLFITGLSYLVFGSLISPFFHKSVASCIIALMIHGIGCSLALVPTFQAIHDAAIIVGYVEGIETYSVISGMWSCVVFLGEMVGLLLSGTLYDNFGMKVVATVFFSISVTAASSQYFCDIVMIMDIFIEASALALTDRLSKTQEPTQAIASNPLLKQVQVEQREKEVVEIMMPTLTTVGDDCSAQNEGENL